MKLETTISKPNYKQSSIATLYKPYVVHIIGTWIDPDGSEKSWVQLWDSYKTLEAAKEAAANFAKKHESDADFENLIEINCA